MMPTFNRPYLSWSSSQKSLEQAPLTSRNEILSSPIRYGFSSHPRRMLFMLCMISFIGHFCTQLLNVLLKFEQQIPQLSTLTALSNQTILYSLAAYVVSILVTAISISRFKTRIVLYILTTLIIPAAWVISYLALWKQIDFVQPVLFKDTQSHLQTQASLPTRTGFQFEDQTLDQVVENSFSVASMAQSFLDSVAFSWFAVSKIVIDIAYEAVLICQVVLLRQTFCSTSTGSDNKAHASVLAAAWGWNALASQLGFFTATSLVEKSSSFATFTLGLVAIFIQVVLVHCISCLESSSYDRHMHASSLPLSFYDASTSLILPEHELDTTKIMQSNKVDINLTRHLPRPSCFPTSYWILFILIVITIPAFSFCSYLAPDFIEDLFVDAYPFRFLESWMFSKYDPNVGIFCTLLFLLAPLLGMFADKGIPYKRFISLLGLITQTTAFGGMSLLIDEPSSLGYSIPFIVTMAYQLLLISLWPALIMDFEDGVVGFAFAVARGAQYIVYIISILMLQSCVNNTTPPHVLAMGFFGLYILSLFLWCIWVDEKQRTITWINPAMTNTTAAGCDHFNTEGLRSKEVCVRNPKKSMYGTFFYSKTVRDPCGQDQSVVLYIGNDCEVAVTENKTEKRSTLYLKVPSVSHDCDDVDDEADDDESVCSLESANGSDDHIANLDMDHLDLEGNASGFKCHHQRPAPLSSNIDETMHFVFEDDVIEKNITADSKSLTKMAKKMKHDFKPKPSPLQRKPIPWSMCYLLESRGRPKFNLCKSSVPLRQKYMRVWLLDRTVSS